MAKKVYTQAVNLDPNRTPQTAPIPGREAEMEPNFGGGWSFTLSPMQVALRFMIMGSSEGTYYADPALLTAHNTDRVRQAIAADPQGVLGMVFDVNMNNRAKSVDSSLLVYSMILADKRPGLADEAYVGFNDLIRTGTHLFTLAEFMKAQKSFGARARRAFSNWYTSRSVSALARQVTKYQQREGWSHADVLRLAHINPSGLPASMQASLRWASGQPITEHTIVRKNNPDKPEVRPDLTAHLPPIIVGFELAKKATTVEEIVSLIQEYKLEREHIPTHWLNYKEVWMALGFTMKLAALIRNLNKMTKVGIFEDPEMVTYVGNRITSVESLIEERVHPLAILLAAKTYALGHGMKGNLEWTPVKAIVDALDAAFYLAFGTIVPINKPILFSMDVSSSMGQKLKVFKKEEDGKADYVPVLSGGGYDLLDRKYEELPLTVCEAQAAIALVMARTEPNIKFGVFSQAYHLIDFDKNQTLEQATKLLSDRNFGGTDCATPFMYATVHKMEVDAFIVTTDGETWAGTPHPATAFKRYKSEAGRASRSAVVAMTSTGFSIADPSDPSMLDVCGFDTNMFTVISEFMRGEI